MNHPHVPVHRRARVALLATGDELVMPGTTPGHGQIVYSNGFALMAQVAAEGAEVIDLGIAPDRLDATIAAVARAKALGVDVLVTTGGASVGEHDLVQKAFAAEGMALSFWKVALRPGRPLMHGRSGHHAGARACPATRCRPSSAACCFSAPCSAGSPAAPISGPTPNWPCSAATCRPTTSAPTTCAPSSPPAPTVPWSRPLTRCRTAPCWRPSPRPVV